MSSAIIKARSSEHIDAAGGLVWELFDSVRARYPDMIEIINGYIEDHDVAGQLDRFGDYFLPPNGECFLARRDHVFVGVVLLKPRTEGGGDLNRMYVRDSARGLGLGRKLCEAAVEEARALGYGTLYLDALHRHVEALPLYESMGFDRYTDPSAFGGDDPRVVNMRLKL